jgi:hypothetical protein
LICLKVFDEGVKKHIFGHFSLSINLKKNLKTMFQKLDMLPSSGETVQLR